MSLAWKLFNVKCSKHLKLQNTKHGQNALSELRQHREDTPNRTTVEHVSTNRKLKIKILEELKSNTRIIRWAGM
jgi:hypothetical protein